MGKGCTAWIATACAALVAAPAAGAAPSTDADRMLQEVNQLRAWHGLPALTVSESLSRSSRRFAAWQMRSDRFGHLDRIRAGAGWGALGEAIAIRAGHRPRVSATLRSWARSPSHAALLLSPEFAEAGAGLSRGRFGRRRATIWVIRLGSRVH
jgi:uncharacterized protein YkwD